MPYSKVKIKGLRGFKTEQTLDLGINNSKPGSGLTVIVGPNNSGKSTIYESFRAIGQSQPPSFTEGKRNKEAGDMVKITIENSEGKYRTLKTTDAKGSETEFVGDISEVIKVFTLPSRRTFSPFFSKESFERDAYLTTMNMPPVRGAQLERFHSRLFNIQKNPGEFNKILAEVLDTAPNWNIEQSDNGQYYIKFTNEGLSHNSDGAGEGLLSIFTIVDALFDSVDGDLIFIDEPELSLHPSLQRKLAQLLVTYSATRQIVISTHSPFFISWESLVNSGKIVRTVKETDETKIYKLGEDSVKEIASLIGNLNNPHILGIDAKEIFFLNDEVILVEGQEDVIFLNKVFELNNLKVKGNFYGWGVGGVGNMKKIAKMLSELGFKKVVLILDNNVKDQITSLKLEFPDYHFISIPTDDVRDKPDRIAREAVKGLISIDGTEFHLEHSGEIISIASQINEYFKPIEKVDQKDLEHQTNQDTDHEA